MAEIDLTAELRLLRFRNRISQTDLSREMGIERSTLAGWEARRRDPHLSGLMSWAKALGKKVVLE